jgi:glutathione synthase
MGVGDLTYYANGQMGAHVHTAPDKKYRSVSTFLEGVKSTSRETITATDLDVLMLRNDPAEDIEKNPWAQNAGVIFGQLAAKQKVIVLNDPDSLSDAMNKMYFQHFPEPVRPKTIITRNVEDVKGFYTEHNGKVVMKPLQGSGGRNVFVVTKKEENNINQIFEAISRDGYVIVQEYLTEAKEGDIRLFLLNGNPIIVDGKYCALHRLQKDGDIRSNIHRGGKAAKAIINDTVLELVEMVRPKLIEDGMFLVGLDIVGKKIMEINVFSPGGVGQASVLNEVDFIEPIMEAIERKVNYKTTYKENELRNRKIATI